MYLNTISDIFVPATDKYTRWWRRRMQGKALNQCGGQNGNGCTLCEVHANIVAAKNEANTTCPVGIYVQGGITTILLSMLLVPMPILSSSSTFAMTQSIFTLIDCEGLGIDMCIHIAAVPAIKTYIIYQQPVLHKSTGKRSLNLSP